MDKLITHSLVHGLEDAAITKDATKNKPRDRLTLMKIGQSVRIKRLKEHGWAHQCLRGTKWANEKAEGLPQGQESRTAEKQGQPEK